MPINAKELDAASRALEFLQNKLPKMGMTSTLDGLIANAPAASMPLDQWEKFLKPGQTLNRAGVSFPLKSEELEYSGLPQLFAEARNPQRDLFGQAGIDPGNISREQLQTFVRKMRPDFNATILSKNPSAGAAEFAATGTGPRGRSLPDIEDFADDEGSKDQLGQNFEKFAPIHSKYSLQSQGALPNSYEVNVTTSPSFGEYPSSHFTPRDLSWSRATVHPSGELDPTWAGPRLINEIQSDWHQNAAEKLGQGRIGDAPMSAYMTPEERENYDALHQARMEEENHRDNNLEEGTPDWMSSRRNQTRLYDLSQDIYREATDRFAKQRVGYRTPEDNALLNRDPTDMPLEPTPEDDWALTIANRRSPDAPFKTPQDYGMLEMKKQLLRAVEDNNRFLGIVGGKEQGEFYGGHLSPDQQSGMDYMYGQVYPSVLKKLARQYGAPMTEAGVELPGLGRPQAAHLPVHTEMGIAPTDDRSDHYPSNLIDHTYEDTEDPTDVEALSNKFRNQMMQHPDYNTNADLHSWLAQAADNHSSMVDAHREWTDPDADDADREAARNEWENQKYRVGRALDNAYRELPYTPPPVETRQYPAMELTPEVVDKIKKAGVPLWAAAGATGAGALMHNDDADANVVEDQAMENANAGHAAGGPIDHVGFALQHLGLAGGGEVKTALGVGDLIKEFISLWEKADTPHFTDEDMSRISQIHSQLGQQGVDSLDLVRGAMPEETEHADGGSISLNDLAEGNTTGVNPQADYGSSLNALKNKIMSLGNGSPDPKEQALGVQDTSGDLPARAAVAIAKPFYGTDKGGHLVAGGGAWTEEQGGTPPAIIDRLASMPHAIAKLADMVAGTPPVSAAPKGSTPEEASEWANTKLADSPLLTGSRKAGERADATNAKAMASVGFPKSTSLGQDIADNADAIIPVPALKMEGAAEHALGMLGASSLEHYPSMNAGWATINGLLETAGRHIDNLKNKVSSNPSPEDLVHTAAQGHADGGQPTPPPQPEAPTEDSLLSDMLQRRVLMRQAAPPVPIPDSTAPMTMGEGGEVSAATKIAQLLQKLMGGAEKEVPQAAAPMVPKTNLPAVQNPDMAAHVADIQQRNWSANANPQDIFTRAVQQNPDMAEHAADIQNRNWAAGMDEGGTVKTKTPKQANVPQGAKTPPLAVPADWADIRRRLAILQNPTISGPPPSTIPPMPVNADTQRAQQQDMVNRLMGKDMAQQSGIEGEQMGPMSFNSGDSDLLAALRAKLLGSSPAMQGTGRMTHDEIDAAKQAADSDTSDQTMARGGRMAGGGEVDLVRRGLLKLMAATGAGAAAVPKMVESLATKAPEEIPKYIPEHPPEMEIPPSEPKMATLREGDPMFVGDDDIAQMMREHDPKAGGGLHSWMMRWTDDLDASKKLKDAYNNVIAKVWSTARDHNLDPDQLWHDYFWGEGNSHIVGNHMEAIPNEKLMVGVQDLAQDALEDHYSSGMSKPSDLGPP